MDVSTCVNASLAPTSSAMLDIMSSSTWSLTLLIVCSILTGACILIYIETIMYISLRLPYGTRRGFLIFLLGCFPVYATTSLLSIYFPRANQIAGFAASVYLSVCVYTFVLLIVNYFGGYENMLKILHDERFSLGKAPCCCCRCLPKIKLTMKSFHRIRFMVMQMTLVRPIALFIVAILWADGIVGMCFTTYQTVVVALNLIATVSTLCAIYGLALFYEMSIRPLRKFYVRPKFFGMKSLLLLTNLQRVLFSVLTRFGVIGCLSPLPCDPEFTSNVLYHMTVAIEMPILLLVGRSVVSKFVKRFRQLERAQAKQVAALSSSATAKSGTSLEMTSTRDRIRSQNDLRLSNVASSRASSPETPPDEIELDMREQKSPPPPPDPEVTKPETEEKKPEADVNENSSMA